jgi:hypothetical protein
MSFDNRAARLRQELRGRGRLATPMIIINDPEEGLDAYRLPDWVVDELPTIELGRAGGLGSEPESAAEWIARLSREAEAAIAARGEG